MTYKLTISNWYFKLLTLIVNSVLSHYWNSFLTLLPLQQLKGPLQNNSKVFLLSLSVTQFEVMNQTPFWLKQVCILILLISSQCRVDLSSVFTTTPLTLSSCPERFIHRINIFFVVLSWLFDRFESLTIVIDDLISFLPQRNLLY